MSQDPVGTGGSEDSDDAGADRTRFFRVVAELFAGIAICAALVAMVDGFGG